MFKTNDHLFGWGLVDHYFVRSLVVNLVTHIVLTDLVWFCLQLGRTNGHHVQTNDHLLGQ